VEYARTDVHFLLFIADMLQAELRLKGGSALQDAYHRSHAMCLSLYAKPAAQVHSLQQPGFKIYLKIEGNLLQLLSTDC
jgi:ribonuclease D